MTNYREIVTKAVIAKGKKTFITDNSITLETNPSTVLGCWVINHNFNGVKNGDTITITGSYDINIWYSYDNDSKTDVIKKTNTYTEIVHMRNTKSDALTEEIIVRSLKQPNCIKAEIKDNRIDYSIEKELGVELVGDVKVKIEAAADEEPWEEILEEADTDREIEKLNDDYIEEIK